MSARRRRRRAAVGAVVAETVQMVEPPRAPEPVEPVEVAVRLEDLTVPLLREAAARAGITLGKARTKAAIIRALRP